MNHAAEKRAERILAQLYETGHVTVTDLAAKLGVSQATVRRDLKTLAERNQAELVHGGARRPRNFDFSFRFKAMRNVQAKQTAGRLAVGIISNNEHIFMDSGTTCFAMASFLRRKHGLTVIANSARLIEELADGPGINIVTLGGRYRPDRMDTVGPLATNTLDQLRGYVAFIGADGLSMDFGLMASDIESADLYRLAVRNARDSILVVDHTKFLTPSLYKIVDWEPISKIVTDKRPPGEWIEFLAGRNIEMIVPETAPTGEQIMYHEIS